MVSKFRSHFTLIESLVVIAIIAIRNARHVSKPDKIFTFGDSMTQGGSNTYRLWGSSVSTDIAAGSSFCFRHQLLLNAIFLDGHAGKIKNNGLTFDEGHAGTIIWHREEKFYPFTETAAKSKWAGPDLGGRWGQNAGSLNPPALQYLR